MPNIKRQTAGRQSRANGEIFERRISNACEFYHSRGIAHIEKTPEPMRPLKPYGDRAKGQYVAIFEKAAQPDYKGILCDGTGIMFEAKHTDKDRIRQDVITPVQWENLDNYERFGAHCYVMVSLGLEKFYRVPWSIWKQMKGMFGHKYMSADELEPYRLQEWQCTILILEGVELRDDYTENGTGTESK